jgi:chondroitin AC lyase
MWNFILILLISVSSWASDNTVLKTNFRNELIITAPEVSTFFVSEITTWKNTIRPDGSWADVGYDLNDNQFSPGEHPKRMDYMARAYQSVGHKFYQDKTILKSIINAFDFWVSKDPQSYNWWHNTIGVPQRFARVMLLLENHLDQNRIQAAIKILNRAEIQKTGQNRLWYSELVLIRGLFTNKSSDISNGSKELHKIITIATSVGEEGLQTDLSFHQHGSLIYNGGYGAKFSMDGARLAQIFSGTKYMFDREKIDILSSSILDGQIWMTRGDKWDYSVTGREITRKKKNAESLIKACRILKDIPLPRQKEFQKCYESLTSSRTFLEGNKFFWRSDYMLHQNQKFFSSVRMYSDRTINNDAPSNSEGLLSHHLADGANFIMSRGDEYEDVFPVWDWRRIPGTTVEDKTLKPAVYEPGSPELFNHIRYFGQSSFVGGLSNGKEGFAAMDLIPNEMYEKLFAKKGWFFAQDGIVAVGNSINCDGCQGMFTTIDQKNARGEVHVMDRRGMISVHSGTQTYFDISAVYHDNVAYYFPQFQILTVSVENKQGRWNRINGQYSADLVKKNVFSLWLTHEKQNSDYIYSVKPGVTFSEFSESVKNIEIKNLPGHMAQKIGNKISLISFEAQELELYGVRLKLSEPCALSYDTATKELIVSDPTQLKPFIDVEVNGKLKTIQFPTGVQAGKPVINTL